MSPCSDVGVSLWFTANLYTPVRTDLESWINDLESVSCVVSRTFIRAAYKLLRANYQALSENTPSYSIINLMAK